MKTKRFIPALVAGLALSGAAQAMLVDNGNGLIYDSGDDITWLQDANLPATNNFGVAGVNPDGSLQNWSVAAALIDAMNTANYLGHSDWRLPTKTDIGQPGCQQVTGTGADDCGWNSKTGELADLYYNEMNGTPDVSTSNTVQASSFNPGPFQNVQTGSTAAYWYGTSYASNGQAAWVFDFTGGLQFAYDKTTGGYSFWAVLPGNATGTPAAVPEPEAWLMMLAGLGMVGSAVARRRRG